MATKARKQELVSELQDFFADGKVAIITDLSGLTVAEFTDFRRKLAKDNSKCKVAKNTLIKIASKDTEFETVKEISAGPSAIVMGYQDPTQTAKVTVEFLDGLKKGIIRGGIIEGKLITAADVKSLSKLPSKDQLLASIMGSMDNGARGIAGLLEAIIRDIALLTEEVAKKNNAA